MVGSRDKHKKHENGVSVPVIDDKLAEGRNETFDLILIVPSSLGPAIAAGVENIATSNIIDTTSKYMYISLSTVVLNSRDRQGNLWLP